MCNYNLKKPPAWLHSFCIVIFLGKQYSSEGVEAFDPETILD